ncbi:MAG: EthD family reductase [Phycisphaerae bacterium]
MVKLIALYSKPANAESFEQHYRNVHMPLAARMPGLRKTVLGWVRGSPMGEARYHLVAELYFDSHEALKAAMKSPEGAAAAKDLMGFAGELVHLLVADVQELN